MTDSKVRFRFFSALWRFVLTISRQSRANASLKSPKDTFTVVPACWAKPPGGDSCLA
jgi:hypothetical protein